ncbi:MAG: NAD(P)H-dependent oxidoreductase [Cyclobacteriaceae bacterium]|nr:NAD(P)H-dependent oxidoreductase [Cyclobacteriaceae bacterium]
MKKKRNILAINGSASEKSSNLILINQIIELSKNEFNWTIFDDLTKLPHFKTELTDENTPEIITKFRNQILNADGILICTPEYVFSIPSGLKNAIEWCVSTTVFSHKPIGLITASTSGLKGHAELKLIMETVETKFTEETTLLIQGIKGKISKEGKMLNTGTKNSLKDFVKAYIELVVENTQ